MIVTLMSQNRETLRFDVDSVPGVVRDAQLLEDFAWAPLGIVRDGEISCELLERFVRGRAIHTQRADLQDILEATGTRSPVELALRAGGLSLSDPYWYKVWGSTLA